MTQEEKQLLLQELCARLPYGVKVNYKGLIRPLFSVSPTQHYKITLDNAIDGEHNGLEFVRFDDEIKPYLRPMSSMTEDEKEKLKEEHKKDEKVYAEVLERIASGDKSARGTAIPHFAADWCNKKHFDYRGLIPMGLALEAPEGMYKIE